MAAPDLRRLRARRKSPPAEVLPVVLQVKNSPRHPVMFRRKTIIVLVITLMVTAMVSAFSYLYISQILRLRIENANTTATNLTRQLAYAARNAVPDFSSTKVDTSNPAAEVRDRISGRISKL